MAWRAIGAVLLLFPIASAGASAPSSNLPPDAALAALKAGNARFVDDGVHCRQHSGIRKKLASGQAPDAIVLSCSDSRVPPELVFDQELGELFVVRVAGNILSDEALASIEYALTHLGSRLIVVMGHDSCGAVKAALATPKGGDAGSPSLNELIGRIQANLGEATAADSSDPAAHAAVVRNVSAVAGELITRSEIVRKAVEAGRARIVRAVYAMESGKVGFDD
jgi:carbonic anhydrase